MELCESMGPVRSKELLQAILDTLKGHGGGDDVLDLLKKRGWGGDDIETARRVFEHKADTDENALKSKFYKLAQSKTTNKLSKKLTERAAMQLDLHGRGSIIEKDFKLFIEGYSKLESGVKQSAAMLLDCLIIVATENGLRDTLVRLPLKKYMEMRGLSDEKEIRKQIKGDMEALKGISFEYRGIGKSHSSWFTVHIWGGTAGQVKNGEVIFRFNQDFFDSFKAGGKSPYLFMYFPREALQGSIKANPWKYWLARKISEHRTMNAAKTNENIIGIKTLIEACPNYPTYEEVIQEDRAIRRRLIDPFERDLNALAPTITWEYQGGKRPATYDEFMAGNVIVFWNDYPLMRIESKTRKGKQPVGADEDFDLFEESDDE
jgi:hypothetical protein